ncbi:MAG TPA: hypothetical protein VGR54_05100 [Nitrosopumilaceae archaeon]|nr:hypothetical protein [Nitrosopumilaceae archaeon]
MTVQKIAWLVFLFPVVISIVFGASVLSNVLAQPDRHLNMWQFVAHQPVQTGDKNIKIQNLLNSYSTFTPVNITVLVNNTAFDCGDLYITIYDLNTSPNQTVAQNGYFSQCFAENNLTLPIHDTFSQIIGKPGNYEIVTEMKDKNNQNAIKSTANFKVQ